MTGRTHLLFSVGLTWCVEWNLPLSALLVASALAALGALLPDLDSPVSWISLFSVGGIRPLQPLARLVYSLWGHRGPLHSWIGLLFTLILALALSPVLGLAVALALPLGYGSHLLLDSMTRTGIPLLYPRRTRYFLLRRPYRFVTGSMAEEVFLVLVATALLVLLLLHLAALINP